MKVESVEEVEQIPEHCYKVGFNDYYITPEGKRVSVPNGTEVPDEWELIAD